MMVKHALSVRLEAKPGKERALADFLSAGLAMAAQEATTPIWFALQFSPSVFGIFDAFATEQDRQAHLSGPIAKALMAQADELLAKPPTIESLDVLGVKNRP
jgi:quinol monooxygenase YgiN